MQRYLQSIFLFLGFVLVVALERAVGLPLFSYSLAAIWLSSASLRVKVPALLVLSAIIAVMYVMPFALSFLLLLFVSLLLEYQGKVAIQQSTRFFFSIVMINGIVAYFIHFPFDSVRVAYHLLALTALLFFIRYWLHYQNVSQVLRISPRLRVREL